MRLNSTVRLTSDGTVQRVDLTYDVQDGDEVQVYFNDDEILTGWTLQRNTNPQRVDFDEKIPAGTLVLIRRYSDMRELPHFFHFTGNAKGGAEFNGKNLDENFDKILRAAQDAMDSFELIGINLEAASDARASANAAATSAANAANYATQANQRANSAQSSATAAAESANTANNHANRAEAALDGVAASAAAAEAAADRAGDSETAAALSASAADQARLAAQASASTASASAVSAGNHASNAAASAAAASGYANTAGIQANAAAGSAAEALTHRNSAADSATAAAFSEDLAQKWAANPEDQVVEAGEYSAKHWALKAAQTVVGAGDVITEDTSEIKFTGTGRALSPLQATIGSVDVSKVEGLGSAATGDVVQGTGNSTTDVMSQKTVTDALNDKVDNNDSRLSNAREWTASTVSQAEAEAGTSTTRRAWTAQRVRQAIVAWFNGVSGTIGRTILGRNTAAQVWGDLGLGTAATRDVGTTEDTVAAGDDSRITGALQKSSNLSDVANKATARVNLGLGTAATRNVGTGSGNVMEVGAFGLGGRGVENNNLEGKSYLAHYAPNTLPTNYPAGVYEYGAMLSIAHGYDGTNMDMVFTHNPDSKILYRYSRNAPWREIYHSGNTHTHPWSQITDAPETATRWPTWGEVSGKPSGFMPPTTQGDVGTYAIVIFREVSGSPTSIGWGETVAGSQITYYNTSVLEKNSRTLNPTLAGVWRIMGKDINRYISNNERVPCLALRIL